MSRFVSGVCCRHTWRATERERVESCDACGAVCARSKSGTLVEYDLLANHDANAVALERLTRAS